MNATQSIEEPKLAKPGAGLPFLEWFVAKYVLIPRRFATTSADEAIAEFKLEAEKIVAQLSGLSAAQLAERRLVPRLRGLEDSSRYWSVAMAAEHLIIVGEGMRKIVLALSHEKSGLPQSKVENVKPSAQVDPAEILARFETMTREFVQTVEAIDFSKETVAKHPHPWFGPLTARQWLLFAPMHERIHRNQIHEIIKRL